MTYVVTAVWVAREPRLEKRERAFFTLLDY